MNRNQRIVYVAHLAFKGGWYVAHLMWRLTRHGWRFLWRWSAHGRISNPMRWLSR